MDDYDKRNEFMDESDQNRSTKSVEETASQNSGQTDSQNSGQSASQNNPQSFGSKDQTVYQNYGYGSSVYGNQDYRNANGGAYQSRNEQTGYTQSGYAQSGYSQMGAYHSSTAPGAAGTSGTGSAGGAAQSTYYQHVYGTPVQGHPNYSYTTKPKKQPKPLTAKSVVAIVLCCALVFSSIGFGSAWMISRSLSGRNTSSQSEAQLPDQFLERPENSVPGGDTEKGSQSSQGSPIAGTADVSRTTDLKLLTASAEEGALTTPEIVQKAQDSVVEIVTELVVTGSYMQQYTTSGAGSGVIITEDGYILTNNHVIKDASSITVTTSDGTSYDATLLGLDEQLDVALLKIDATGLKPVTISTSANLMVGQTVVAIGNPLGQLGGSVTQGIISALDRSITIEGQTMTLMQFDAAINPGNSGGGLFNAQGDLIGLVNAKSIGEDIDGIGFAIPIDKVMEILDDLKTHGYVTGRVAIGVSLLDVASEQMAWMYRVNELGVYVYSVTNDSPAAKGGLTIGDRILSVNGVEVTSSSEVKAQVQSVSIGDTLTFVVSRNGHQVTLSVVAGEYVPEGIPTTTGQTTLEDAA